MKNLVIIILAAILVSRFAFAIGGEQGTGMMKFVDPKNEYSIDYHKSWSVYEIDNRHSFVDKENTTLDKINSLSICKNQYLKIENADELYKLIKQKYPEERFEHITIQGKNGFKNITTRDLGLIFILRGEADLIVVKTKSTGERTAKMILDHMIKSLDIDALRKTINSDINTKGCF